uniref:RHS repeat-associated core domain-containing protein n=1 Tax=Candidatus Kentrum sp. MB TaxID=2138164 RepID=A0A450X4M0_9GAMM|nr:MAG: RHS repeat-associated core domain-containing protein [Candidatus Kentron sp. MB]
MSMQSIFRTIAILALFVATYTTHAANHGESLVGSIPGQLSVQQGAAVYTIPIEVPPGVAGMQPDLAITYNSNGRNGLLGVGFSLSGLSVITRCGQTIAQDGQKGGVYYDSRDRFCLDGQRLIAIYGTDGGNGTEYRTEIDGYSKIVSHGQQGSGPAWWKVWTKAGQVMEFGKTGDSRIEAQGKDTVRLWAVNQIEDTVGNGIDFEYHEDNGNGEYYPTRILYAGGKVEFGYEERSDSVASYEAGSVVQLNNRMKNISTYTDNTLNRSYLIRYEISGLTSRSHLLELNACDQNGNCAPASSFSWSALDKETAFNPAENVDIKTWDNPSVRNIPGDFNGDGLTDFLVWHAPFNNYRYNLYLANGNGFDPAVATNLKSWDNSRLDNQVVGDFNGDGMSDMLMWHVPFNNYRFNLYLSNGNGFEEAIATDIKTWDNPNVRNIPSDFNGDGLTDFLVWHAPFNNYRYNLYLSNGNGFEPAVPTNLKSWDNSKLNNQVVGDFNGDGMSDMLMWHVPFNNYRFNLYLSNGNGFEKAIATDIKTWDNTNVRNISSDFNGDGLTDFLVWHAPFNNYRYNLYLSNGNGFEPAIPTNLESWDNWKLDNQVVGDFNGDDMSDMLMWHVPFKNHRFNLYLSNGKGFQEAIATDIETWDNSSVRNASGDFTGDGLTDFLVWHAPFNNYRFNLYTLEENHNLVTRVNNGATRTTLEYEPLTRDQIHGLDSDAVYPNLDLQNPRYVAAKVKTQDAVGGQNTTTYRYGGLKANLHGRSSLGFRWIEAIDHTRNTITRTEYNQTFPHVGSPQRVTTHLIHDGYGGNILFSKTESEYDYVTRHGDRVYSPHVVRAIERSYDLDRSLLTTVTTENSGIDAFGNLGRITVTTQGAGKTHVKISQNDYVNDEQRWILGRLTRASVTHIAPDNTQITRASEFAYDAQTGLLTLETIEPSTALFQTTRYQYDTHGNKIAVTLSGPGLADRTTQTQYDGLGRFPIRVTNALGHAEIRQYHPGCGKPVSLTGPNGLTTRWEYDSLCRKTLETRADGTKTQWRYQWANSSNNGTPANARYSLTETASGASPVTIWYDAMGREVRRDTIGFDGRAIHQETEYDAKGQITRQSLPHFSGETAYWVSNTYDAIGRPASITRPAGRLTGQAKAITRYAYSGFTTTVTDPMGRRKTTTKNALDRVVRVDEEEGAWLTHTHDAIGNLVETNANGVVTRMGYDIRGNKVWMQDPDMGRWEYTYNAFGELVTQRNAKGQTVVMAYDKLGRMIRREEPEGITTWEYDSAKNGVGKLISVQAPGGFRKEFAYDNLGRPAATTTHADNRSFVVGTRYDSFGRVSESVRPGNLEVERVYNEYGYLAAIRSPASRIADYDWAHLERVLETALKNAENAARQAAQYMKKASEYRALAFRYRQLAAIHSASGNLPILNRLRDIADSLESYADIFQKRANYYRTWADRYAGYAERYARLAARYGGRWIGNRYRQIANYYRYWSDIFVNVAWNNLLIAEESAKQAGSGNGIDILTDSYAKIVAHYVGVAEKYVDQAQKAGRQATHFRQLAQATREDSSHYRDMLEDREHVYFWRTKSRDASSRLIGNIFGNGLVTRKAYDPATGELVSIKSGFGTGSPIRDLEYTYDLVNNVTARADHAQGIRENFQYDRLDRLAAATVTGDIGGTSYNHTLTYSYDNQGNMTHNSGVGSYLYGGGDRPGPHAISRAGSQEIQYDANGSMTRAGDRAIAWTSFNKPKSFQRGGQTVTFDYGPDRARYRKAGVTTNGNAQRTVYIGKLFEQETTKRAAGDIVRRKHFIYADGQLVTIHIKTEQAGEHLPDETRYLHRDNLGSIDTITDGRGNVVERMSYEAFGQRRAGNWRSADDPLAGIILPAFTNRGFTGHEHVDEMGLIHMNGRVYDPRLGRFLSADPHIQAPHSTQSYNRYSYVLNNPLKYTDPSGFFFKKLFRAVKKLFKNPVVRAVVAIAAAAVVGPAAAALVGGGLAGAIVGGTAAGFVAGGISTGTWKGAFQGAALGALSGGIAYGIGHGFGAGLAGLEKTLAHGIAQGGLSELAGGDFRSGFLGGMIGHGVGGWSKGVFTGTNPSAVIGRTMAAAVAGGVSAKLGGGKFANGAITGAFAHLFNNEARRQSAWPTNHKKITSGYDPNRKHPVTGEVKPHLAIDIANPKGDPVYSIRDGVVVEVNYAKNSGNYLKVDHANGFQSSYSHTATSLTMGDSVRYGQTIGHSDGSGVGTGPHLHFVLRKNGNRINPCSELSCP